MHGSCADRVLVYITEDLNLKILKCILFINDEEITKPSGFFKLAKATI